jgi:predicted Zn finger-like uncharacterized protein
MKFVCDKCNTRYSIADERVHGRVLKIRCKACNHVITVREEHPAAAAAPPAGSLEDAFSGFNEEATRVSTSPPPAAEGADEWYVSFDGDQEGPLPLQRALDRVRLERPRGKECFCWRAGFFVWLPVDDVPEFAPALVAKVPPPIPALRPQPAVKSPTGSLPAVKSPTGSLPAVKSPTGNLPAVKSPTGSLPAVKSPTGNLPALKSPTGSLPAVKSPTGNLPALKSPTGSLPAVKAPTGPQPALRGPSGSMNAAAPTSDLPSMDSGPLGTPGALLPSLETKPEPRLVRKAEEQQHQPPLVVPDSAPSPLSPFTAAMKASSAARVEAKAPADAKAPTLDSGPVPLPPPPGDDLKIDEPSDVVNLSHLSRPTLARPKESKPTLETFGGVAVTPSKPTPAPQPIIVATGRAGGPPWMKLAAIGGGLATLALGITVVVLMTRKPTVIVVPPAPNIEDVGGKKVADKPITVDTGPNPTQPAVGATSPADKRAQKRPPSSARAGTTPKPPASNLSDSQRNLAALYGDNVTEHGAKSSAPSDSARGGGSQVSQQAIMAVVTQNRRSLNLCYDRVLKHDASLKSGRVVTHVKIGISGSVTGVSVPDPQYANSEIGQCIAQTIRHWHFPSADSEYETEFPIILQAN